MFEKDKILAIIPARGGSKGIPRKNIIELCGRPLIGYTIETALASRYIDYVMVSTDDPEIARVSKENGAEVPFMRPAELATDTAKTIDVVMHAISELRFRGKEFSAVVLLQPTEPLRTVGDIDGAIEKYYECNCQPLVSLSEVEDHPILIRTIEEGWVKPLLAGSSTCRRQDMPRYYRVNGCIYINAVGELDENTSLNDNLIPYVMEKSHSVDIDEWKDLVLAQYYLYEKAMCQK